MKKTSKPYSLHFNAERGAWIAKYKKIDGSWGTKFLPKKFRINHELDAERELIGWLAKFHQAETVPARDEKIEAAPNNLALLAPKWLEYRKNDLKTARNTWLGFSSDVKNWILDNPNFPHFSIQDLDIEKGELSVQILMKWIATLKGDPSTIIGKIRTLRSLIDDSTALEWLDPNMENPTKKPAITKLLTQLNDQRDEDKVNAHLYKEQSDVLLGDEAVLSEYRKLRYLTVITHGFRDTELQALTWGDINWDEMTITCNKQLMKRGCAPCIHEKDLKLPKDELPNVPNAIVGKPKTAASRRTLPLHSVTAEALKYWFTKGWGIYVGRKPTLQDPIFPRGYNGRRDLGNPGEFCFSESAELFRKDLERLDLPTTFTDKTKGITVNLTFHCIRHTFSHLLESIGADEFQVDVLLGHAAKTVARGNYLGKNVEVFRKLVEAIPLPSSIPLQYTTIGKQKEKGKVIPFKTKKHASA